MNHAEGSPYIGQKRIRMPICDKTVLSEISNDYTLPDYHPEIRRVLYVGSNILPPSKYVSAGGAEYSGIVDYSIIYVGVDGKLYSAPLSAEYSFNLPINTDGDFDFNEGVSSCADVVSESVTTRLLGPRKINIKSKLKAHARAYATMLLDEKTVGEVAPDSIQTLIREENICDFTRVVGEVVELSEEIIPDGPDCRIISADGKVFISDINTDDGAATLRGEVYLTLLAEYGDSPEVTQIQRKIPFSQTVENENLTKGSRTTANGYISDISVNIEEQGIICDISLILDLEAQCERKFSYLGDVYSTKKSSEAEYKKYEIPTAGYCINGNFSMNEKMSKENVGFPQNATIIDVYGNATAEKTLTEGSKKTVLGQVKYAAILLVDGEYSSLETVLPFKYEFDAGSTSRECSACEANINVISCKIRQDAEEISIDAELSLSAWGSGSTEITALSQVRFENDVKAEKGKVIIYYPSSTDTLWSIAKRYFVPVSKIQTLNGISDDVINKEYLII